MKRTIAVIALNLISGMAIAGTTGTYKVPAGQYLDQDVLLKSPKVNINEKSDGTLELVYRLPRELDGKNPRTIKMTSTSSTNRLQLAGPDGVSLCEPVSDTFSCSISYFKDQTTGLFGLNTPAAAEYMQARNFSPARVELMEKAQQSIMHEAAGILFIRKR